MTQAHVRRDMRKHRRRIVNLPVLVRAASGRLHAAISFDSTDLSHGGAFLRSELFFEVGEVLELEIQVSPGAHLAVRGRVVRVSRAEQAPGMGIEFVDLAGHSREALDRALEGPDSTT